LDVNRGEPGVVADDFDARGESVERGAGGLLATAIHLLGSVLVASSVFLRGVIATYPLLIWVAAFYWTTLITLTISIAQQVRKAPAAANHRAANHG